MIRWSGLYCPKPLNVNRPGSQASGPNGPALLLGEYHVRREKRPRHDETGCARFSGGLCQGSGPLSQTDPRGGINPRSSPSFLPLPSGNRTTSTGWSGRPGRGILGRRAGPRDISAGGREAKGDDSAGGGRLPGRGSIFSPIDPAGILYALAKKCRHSSMVRSL